MIKLRSYTFRVNYSPQRDAYIGTCDQFPRLSYVDADLATAIKGITHRVLYVLDDPEMENDDEQKTTGHT